MPRHFTTTSAATAGRVGQAGRKRYRCVYCHKGTKLENLPSHEAQCDARFIVQRGWAMTIEKARVREKQKVLA